MDGASAGVGSLGVIGCDTAHSFCARHEAAGRSISWGMREVAFTWS